MRCSSLGAIALLLAAPPAPTVQAQSVTERAAERLRDRLEAAGDPPQITVGREMILANGALPAFYLRRLYRPAWSDDTGPLPTADDLLAALRQADAEGLRPADYHLVRIRAVLAERQRDRAQGRPPDPDQVADLDLLLTDAFLVYGSHLLHGRVNPETVHSEWKANRRGTDLGPVLAAALTSRGVRPALRDLAPPQPGYARLREARARYQRIVENGGWPRLPPGSTWARGSRGPSVELLRRRLTIGEDLRPADAAGTAEFDAGLEAGVRRFQSRHGLEITGRVDGGTLAALNVPAAARLEQMELNLERWRWLPQDLGVRHILVNIADYRLQVIEGARSVLTMRVMVGTPYRRTPVFSDTLRYLVLSPSWEIPRTLAVQDKLPRIKRNVRYLAQQKITVLQGWGTAAREIDPATVDWTAVTPPNFAYRLRQEPGPLNALGRVKFMFPNPYNVYLHDTPSLELFDRVDRDFSSGCIRVERPLDLAAYLLSDARGWTRERIETAARSGKESSVAVPRPIPVHLEYWTAWVEEDGSVQFRRDPYGRDPQLAAALDAPPPVPTS